MAALAVATAAARAAVGKVTRVAVAKMVKGVPRAKVESRVARAKVEAAPRAAGRAAIEWRRPHYTASALRQYCPCSSS